MLKCNSCECLCSSKIVIFMNPLTISLSIDICIMYLIILCRDSWYCCTFCDIMMLQFYFNIVYLNVVNVFFHFKFTLCKVYLNLLFIHKYICMYFYLFHSNPCLMCAKASSQLNLNIICNPNLH